jgi:glucokinase
MMGYAIGLDAGVTNVKAVCVTPSGEVLAREQFETHAESPDWPKRVQSQVAKIEQSRGRANFVGLAAPGVAMSDGSCIRWMRGRLAEVQRLHWGELLGRRVPVLNDAQAALLGEVWQGAARGQQNVVLLTLGTGVGGAAIVDGHLLRGWLGRAGHLGHICLDLDGEKDVTNVPGSLEVMIGKYTIARRTGGRFKSTLDMIAACRDGDADAKQAWERSIKALACGITSLINVLDPQTVVIGGGIATAGDALFDPLARELKDVAWSLEGEQVRIVPAELGEFAGAIGAAYQAVQESSGA